MLICLITREVVGLVHLALELTLFNGFIFSYAFIKAIFEFSTAIAVTEAKSVSVPYFSMKVDLA